MSKNEIIGTNIIYLINNTPGMNKSKLARELGVDVRTVRRWTNNGFFPTEYVTDIAAFFGVSLDVLLNVDLTGGVDLGGEDHWNVLRSNINNLNQIIDIRQSYNEYLRSLGVEISFERDLIEGTDLHAITPNRVHLSLNGKESTMDYSDYENVRNKISATAIKKLHLD